MSEHRIEIEDILQLVVDEGGSDLHLAVGLPPVVRMNGSLVPLEAPVLAPEDTEYYVNCLATAEQIKDIAEKGGSDFAIGFHDLARFRISILRQKGSFGLVLRQIPSKLLDLTMIGLPEQIIGLLNKPRGLILVTGPTGSGKTSTLASMIDYINATRECHIITVEDPIEYYHMHKKSVITQREVGEDVPSFAEAIRRALRQDPDVILIGEMRDLETMEAALGAAETGHLVMATLHTTGAAATVDRIIDAFPTEQQEQVRTQLGSSMLAVVSQQLLPRMDKPGRIAAFEIMVATASIRALIRDRKTYRITSDIQTGGRWGMTTLDDSLFQLYQAGIIRYEDMISKAQDEEELLGKLQKTKD
ncbi:MAG: type IV pilus twitching motility protein PilT [Spartobacteria bacterium]|nr:type IV pilus twitching motility protein PilT [Spartobacteria bacterium]